MIISIDIPDSVAVKTADAFANLYHRPEMVTNPEYDLEDPKSIAEIPNPISKAQFAKQKIRDYIKEVYVAGNLVEINAAKDASITEIKTESEVIETA